MGVIGVLTLKNIHIGLLVVGAFLVCIYWGLKIYFLILKNKSKNEKQIN